MLIARQPTRNSRTLNNLDIYIFVFIGLRHCATSRKVAGSIPDGGIGIFHRHIPSGRTVALGLIQPLTEMNTRNISCGVKAAGA